MKFIEPMLLDSRETPFDSSKFIFEPKANGVRLELISSENGIKLFTRHGNDITSSLPEITSLKVDKGIILDGELVCYDPENPLKEDFEAVMSRITSKKSISVEFAVKKFPTTFIVFDILFNKNKSILNLPLLERKQILDKVVENQPHMTKVVYVAEKGKILFEIIKQHELEGMVAKRLDSRYQAGKRPKDVFYKIINWYYSDCVITGYRKDSVGWYLKNDEGKGFVEFGISPKQKKEFYPLAETLKTGENENSVWIQPVIKCRVKHRGFLRSGNMMTPVFVEFLE
jgi:DNA ligase-1